jgi:hypothetical protein
MIFKKGGSLIQDSVWLYKYLPLLIRAACVLGAIIAGYLLYSGLTTRTEKLFYKLRVRNAIQQSKQQFQTKAERSKLQDILREAGFPLGLNAVRYKILHLALMVFLILNYIVYPYWSGEGVALYTVILIIALYVGLLPDVPFSLAHLILKKWIEYRRAKRNSELYSLYDMIISELEMMQTMRINCYSLLRTLKPYFQEIEPDLNRLLAQWNSDKGPSYALDLFAKEMGTREAEALATILKTFDENKKETILTSLRGMEDMFVNSQIENYRRRRKLLVDLASIPIKATHYLIILNFVIVIVYMVSVIFKQSHM